jgi:hypothetical protein
MNGKIMRQRSKTVLSFLMTNHLLFCGYNPLVLGPAISPIYKETLIRNGINKTEVGCCDKHLLISNLVRKNLIWELNPNKGFYEKCYI